MSQNWKNIGWMLLGVLIIIAGSQFSIDLNLKEVSIPITGQSLVVLLVGFLLGRKWGSLAVFVYLLLGVLDFPVFAEGKFGWETFKKGSGGFLYGFLFAAYTVGILGDKGWGRNFAKSLIAMTLGTIIIIVFGVMHLSFLYGFEKALEYGFFPFWRGAVVKILLGTIVAYGITWLLNRK